MDAPQFSILSGLLDTLATLTLLTACIATVCPLAATIAARDARADHWCAAAVVASWLLTGLFYALAPLGAFRLPVALSIWLASALTVQLAIGRRDDLRKIWIADARAAFGSLQRAPTLALALASVSVAAVLALRTFKGLVTPPLAWDALTYHLLKAGRWVQHGGWAPDAAPDAWRYYEHFPPGGDILWAWAMVPTHSDAFIALAGAFAWLACLLAGYGPASAIP